MTTNAHLTQPRDSGKFSFKTSPESGTVRLGASEATEPAAATESLDYLRGAYSAGAPKGSPEDKAKAAATLALLNDAARYSSMDEEAMRYLYRRSSQSGQHAYAVEHQKVAFLDIPGKIRRRRETRAAKADVESTRRAASLMQFELHVRSVNGSRTPKQSQA